MPIQDDIAGLGALIQNEFTNVTPTNKISADDVKNLATKTVSIATEIGAKLVENDTTDATQTAKDVTHDTKIAALEGAKTANDAIDASQSGDIIQLKASKLANDATDATQSGDIAALKAAKVENDSTNATQTAQIVDNQVVDVTQSAQLSKQEADIIDLKAPRIQAAQVFFVDRRYASQSEMEAQDLRAVQGSMERPFATPYSAKKAAIVWLSANPSKQAIIEIARGNVYTLSDYVPALHDVVVEITGAAYVSGVELAYHGITYILHHATIDTPLCNKVILSAQAQAGQSEKPSVFMGGRAARFGFNTNAQSNIYMIDMECVCYAPDATHVWGDAGLKHFSSKITNRTLVVGDRWNTRYLGDATLSRHHLTYETDFLDKPHVNDGVSLSKIHNKDVEIRIKTAVLNGPLLDIGHNNPSAGAGLQSGLNNSTLYIKVENTVVASNTNFDASIMTFVNNSNSHIICDLCDFKTSRVSSVLRVLGTQLLNTMQLIGLKIIIDNPTSTRLPFDIALGTSKLIIKGWEIESNVLVTLFTVISGKVVLKNCLIRQSATARAMFHVAEGATVTAENCHFVMGDRVTPLTTGTGKFVSKNSTCNVAFGTAVLKGDLKRSKWYDETLNQTENWQSVTGATTIPNPDGLRLITKTDVNTAVEVGQTKFFNGLILMEGDNGTTVAVIESSASGITVTQDSGKVFEYALISTNYILGA